MGFAGLGDGQPFDQSAQEFSIDNNALSDIYVATMQKNCCKLLVFRWLLAACLTLLLTETAAAGVDVVNIRLGVHPDSTRVVLDLSGSARYRIEPQTDAERIVVVIETAGSRLQAPPAGRGLVKAIRVEPDAAGSRMVLELSEPAHVTRSQSLIASGDAPARIFVDLQSGAPDLVAAAISNALAAEEKQEQEARPGSTTTWPVQLASTAVIAIPGTAAPVDDRGPAAAAITDVGLPIPPAKPDLAASEDAAEPQLAMLEVPAVVPPKKPAAGRDGHVPVIVLDAGHGGKDPGAVGANGTMEKDITLQMARELKALLESGGRYKVILTREEDELLALRQRIDAARAAGADLFISLHADHVEQASVRGASVYTLSENASDAEAARLAARENKEDLITGVDLSSQNPMVTSILIDLAQRETKNLSARFASMLSEELADHTHVIRNSHRFAGFVVLKAPDVPSVLVELGYLSNENDEVALASKRHRRVLGRSIRDAIDRYFEWQQSFR
jgi:N-acetylmuramoyl-L-alanine amidase